jgi:hypothetical protein
MLERLPSEMEQNALIEDDDDLRCTFCTEGLCTPKTGTNCI